MSQNMPKVSCSTKAFVIGVAVDFYSSKPCFYIRQGRIMIEFLIFFCVDISNVKQ